MDRNLWVRIHATGATQASAAIRSVGQAIRQTALQTRVAGSIIRTSASNAFGALNQGVFGLPTRLANAGSALKTFSSQVATQARVISSSLGRTMAAGGIISPKIQGNQFTQGVSQMVATTRTGLGMIGQNFKTVSSTIGSATRDWTNQVRAFSANSVGSMRTGWNTMAQTVAINSRFIGQTISSSIGGAVNNVRGRLTKLGTEQATAAHTLSRSMLIVGGAITLAFGLAIHSAANFQEQMNNVNSVVQGSDKLIASLSEKVLELSLTLPQSPTQLAAGLYEVAQAGYYGAGSFTVLKAAATAASAGLTDTVTASRGLIAILNAYGKGVGEAKYVSDVLFQTVKVGIVSFEELSQQIGDFVGFAAAAGIKIEDLGIAMATMTRAGIPAAEASTSLNRVIQALVKPSVAMKTAFAQLNIGVDDLKDGGLGLTGVIDTLRKSTGGNIVVLQKLFPEIRAARGAYALMADDGKLLNKVMKQFGEHSEINGQTARALAKQAQGLNFQWQITKNTFSTASIELGMHLLPALTNTVKAIATMVKWWKDLPGPVKAVVTIFTALVGITAVLGGIVIGMAPRLVAMNEGLVAMGFSAGEAAVGVRALMASFGVISIALVVGAALFAHFASKQDDATTATTKFGQAVRETGEQITIAAREALAKDLTDKGLVKYMKDLHVSSGLAISAIQGVDGASAALTKQIASSSAVFVTAGKKGLGNEKYWAGLTVAINKGGGALNKYIDDLNNVGSTAAAARAAGGPVDPDTIFTEKQRNNAQELAKVLKFVADARAEGIAQAQAYRDQLAASGQSEEAVAAKTRGLGDAYTKLNLQQGQLSDSQKAINELYKNLISPAGAYEDTFNALKPLTNLTGIYSDLLSDQQDKINKVAGDTNRKHNQSLTDATKAAAAAARNQKRIADDQYAAASAAAGKNTGLRHAAAQASKDQKRQADDAARAVADANSKLRTVTEDYKHDAQVSLGQFISGLGDAVKKQRDYYTNIKIITEKGFGGLAMAVADGSKESADLLQILAQGTKKQLGKVSKQYEELGPKAGQSLDAFISQLEARKQAMETVNANIFRLIAKGREDLVTAIQSSDLDPSAQANLINKSVKGTKKQLDDLTSLLQNGVDKSSDVLAVQAETSRTVFSNMQAHIKEFNGAVNFNQLYAQYKKLTGDTTTTKDSFITALTTMGTAIDELPKDVKTVVSAYVNGADEVQRLNDELQRFTELAGSGKTGLSPRAIENTQTNIKKQINALVPQISASAKSLSVSASSVYISTKSVPHGAAQANGSVVSRYADGGMSLPKDAIVQRPQRNLVQWAEPETGGEAFIPLASSKRRRSVKILDEVAERFGFNLVKAAAGGIHNAYDNSTVVNTYSSGGIHYVDESADRRKMYAGAVVAGAGMGVSGVSHVTNTHSSTQRVSESTTYLEPVYVDKVVAHDYNDFRSSLDREKRFRTMPGNIGGR